MTSLAAVRVKAHAAITWIVAAIQLGLAEKLTALVIVIGWLLITDAIARLPHCAPAIVWRLSLGALALSLGGLKLFGQMAWRGLYDLTRDD